MKRLFILLLICLLPTQVFAGSVSYAQEHTEQTEMSKLIDEVFDTVLFAAQSIDLGSAGDSQDQDQDDRLMHIGAGDEPAIHAGYVFAPDLPAFVVISRSDIALQPPFLPPAGRPPRA
jgi:hypothetical protein